MIVLAIIPSVSTTAGKTIDISNTEKAGFEPFVQQDFHELLKYLTNLYRDAAEHVQKKEVEESS